MATRTRPQMTLETRATLIALARDAFGKHGFAGVALDDLTAAAGMTRGALYHHFANKIGLFEAVANALEDALDDTVQRATEAAGGGWPGFRAGCRAFLRALRAPDVQRILLRDAPAVIPQFANRPRMQLCTAQMVDGLSALMDDGVIRRTDPHALASAIAGAITNAAAWGAARPDPAGALDAVEKVVDHLLDGLEVKAA